METLSWLDKDQDILEQCNSVDQVLDQVSADLDQDQLIRIVHTLGKLLSAEASLAPEFMDKLQVMSEFNHEVTSHDNYGLLISRLLDLVPQLHVETISSLYLGLRKLNEPITSPLMTQLYVVLRRNLMHLDLQGITNFMLGFSGFMHNVSTSRLKWRVTSWTHINLTFYPVLLK